MELRCIEDVNFIFKCPNHCAQSTGWGTNLSIQPAIGICYGCRFEWSRDDDDWKYFVRTSTMKFLCKEEYEQQSELYRKSKTFVGQEKLSAESFEAWRKQVEGK